MQNQTLPIQLSPTALAPAPSRINGQANNDGAAFSQTLNREMAQRQAAPAPTPNIASANAPVQPRPAQAVKPVPAPAPAPQKAAGHSTNEDTTSADASAGSSTEPADASASAAPAKTDSSADAQASAGAAADGAAAAAPMADMLALVASYKQLMQGGAGAKTSAADPDAGVGTASARGTGIGVDARTLASLQNALKKSDAAATDVSIGKPALLAGGQPGDSTASATTAASRAAPDLATVAGGAGSQSETALSSLREAASTAIVKDTAPVTGSAFQAQLGSATMLQAAAPAGDHIPARLGSAAWDTQVSQKVVWMVGGLDQSASLTLNPPDLGPVQVVLNVNNDQATVAFGSATPEVRAALENAMPRLREMLGEAGVTLTDASVSANLPDPRQADTGGGARQGGGGSESGNGRGGMRSGETEVPLPRAASRAVRDDGVVDTFA